MNGEFKIRLIKSDPNLSALYYAALHRQLKAEPGMSGVFYCRGHAVVMKLNQFYFLMNLLLVRSY